VEGKEKAEDIKIVHDTTSGPNDTYIEEHEEEEDEDYEDYSKIRYLFKRPTES